MSGLTELERLLAPATDAVPQLTPTEPADTWPGPLPEHLSATQLAMLQRCPEQFRRRYVHHERERPGAALVWGSADHAAHEHNFEQKIASGVDLPAGEVVDRFVHEFERRAQDDEIVWGNDKPDQMLKTGTALVELYHRQVSPTIQPTAVETRFDLAVPGVPVPVMGYVDVTTDRCAIERKTAKRAEREIKPDWRLQGLVYQAVVARPVEWHVSVKTKTPAVLTPHDTPGLVLPHDSAQVAAAQQLVRTQARVLLALWATFGPDEPWPGAITHPWACGFCGFRSTCSWWGNQR